MYDRTIVLISPRDGQFIANVYKPGYEHQTPTPKPRVKQLQTAKPPPVFIAVDFPPRHFEGLVPSMDAADRVDGSSRKLRKSTVIRCADVIDTTALTSDSEE